MKHTEKPQHNKIITRRNSAENIHDMNAFSFCLLQCARLVRFIYKIVIYRVGQHVPYTHVSPHMHIHTGMRAHSRTFAYFKRRQRNARPSGKHTRLFSRQITSRANVITYGEISLSLFSLFSL